MSGRHRDSSDRDARAIGAKARRSWAEDRLGSDVRRLRASAERARGCRRCRRRGAGAAGVRRLRPAAAAQTHGARRAGSLRWWGGMPGRSCSTSPPIPGPPHAREAGGSARGLSGYDSPRHPRRGLRDALHQFPLATCVGASRDGAQLRMKPSGAPQDFPRWHFSGIFQFTISSQFSYHQRLVCSHSVKLLSFISQERSQTWLRRMKGRCRDAQL
jgi:hypothetical protein